MTSKDVLLSKDDGASRLDWDTYFMRICDVVKTRSPDYTKVGAVLVSLKDHRIISSGYNSVKSGLDDSKINWDDREFIKHVVIHAEMNVLLYAKSNFEDSILYTTMSPCTACIKLLSATKVKKIIYKDEYRDIDIVKDLCKFFDIELKKI
jgi:dCMP deaminase